jgi:AcrR family transcriptional regulator
MKIDSVMNHTSSNETHWDGADDRHTRRRERTRAALLDAARQEFARVGFTATGVADITRAADVGVGTFYLHFRDKDEILSALLAEGLARLKDHVATAIAPLPCHRSLPAAVRAICHASFAGRDLFRIAYTASTSIAIILHAQELLATYLTEAIQEAQRLGEVGDDIDPPLTARLITGMISQGTLWWTQHAEPSPDVMADQILRLLREGLPAALFVESTA